MVTLRSCCVSVHVVVQKVFLFKESGGYVVRVYCFTIFLDRES